MLFPAFILGCVGHGKLFGLFLLWEALSKEMQSESEVQSLVRTVPSPARSREIRTAGRLGWGQYFTNVMSHASCPFPMASETLIMLGRTHSPVPRLNGTSEWGEWTLLAKGLGGVSRNSWKWLERVEDSYLF